MKRVWVILWVASFSVIGLTSSLSAAQEKKAQAAAEVKQVRWHGILVNFSKDQSTITVRKQNVDKIIHFDASTKWTERTKTIAQTEFKEGVDVICLGKYDEKGSFLAERIDLRRR